MNAWRVLRRSVYGLTIALCALAVSTAPASEEGQVAADQVSQTSYQGFLNDSLFTHTGHSRGQNGAQHDLARDNIKALFQSYGLTTTFDTFTWLGQTQENVVAEQTGSTYPTRIYIIGGHYDSVNNPGADDNASGVASVLEVARIISQYPSACTIRFMAFDMEEAGLIGSDHYATVHSSEDIRGMLSLDMVCYDPSTNHCLLYGRTASNPIKNALAAAVTEYSGGLTYTIEGQLDASDHASFEQFGFQACLLIEGEFWNNPYYHTQNDKYESPNYLNFPYAVKMTRSVVGWLVDAASVDVPVNTLNFTYLYGQREFVSPAGGSRMRVTVTGEGNATPQPGTGVLHYKVGPTWQAAPMEVVAPNVYNAIFPAAACGTSIPYYVSAEAVGGQVYTDPRNAPTTYYTTTAAYDVIVAYQNNLDVNPGWTTQGLWAFGTPTGGGGQHGGRDPTSGHTGTKVYGYNLSGDYENNLPERHLTSTALNCTGQQDVHLHFWRWLGVEQPAYDHAYVRASNNGTSWTTVWQNPSEIADTSWQPMELDISTVADNQPTVYLRWTMGTSDGGWVYCGWNVDDIELSAIDCVPPLIGDLNCDGLVNFGDIDPFVLALSGQAGYEAVYPNCRWLNADCNDDTAVNFEDIDPFVALLSG